MWAEEMKEVIFQGEYCTDILYFIVLHFIALCRFCIFYKLKVCGNPVLSKTVGAIFPTAFAHFVSVSHFGKSQNV